MHHGRGGGKSTGAADAEVRVVMAMVKIGEKKRRMFEISTDVRLIKGQLRAPTLKSGTHSPTACPTMLKRHPSEGEPPPQSDWRTHAWRFDAWWAHKFEPTRNRLLTLPRPSCPPRRKFRDIYIF
jgi:hypothetical protein